MSNVDPNAWLEGGGGAPSAKFPTIGTLVKGTVTDLRVEQQRDFGTGDPKFYKDGNPMLQLVVTLATDERDPAIEDDDGHRRLFVKGQMKAAVQTAVKATNTRLEPGGVLAVKYVSDKPTDKGAPAKQYVAQYQPAAHDQSAVDDLLGTSSAATPTSSSAVTADSLI